MDFIKVECATCQRPILASSEFQSAAKASAPECMLCKPARYPFCAGCQLPLYVSDARNAPEYCSACRGLQNDDAGHAPRVQFYIEGFVEDGLMPRRVRIESFPFTIGRNVGHALRINRDGVSRNHSQIDQVDGEVRITDTQSKNGTYVNRQRISDMTPIQHGDIIHFADYEFRFLEISEQSEAPADLYETTVSDSPNELSIHFPTQMKEFQALLDQELVQGYCQTIVDQRGQPIGYELLGRGQHPDLPENPAALFALASALGQDIPLSQLFRRRCLLEAHAAHLQGLIFINTHPKECQDVKQFLKDFEGLCARYPDLALVCEIHEAAVTDLGRMGEIRAGLQALGVKLAYDDFGAGQARLLELTQAPPDILKFDYSLITGLTSVMAPTYQLVKTLTELVKQMGIKTLAEGVESEDVARTCRLLGIDYIQGFYYSRPAPIASHAAPAASAAGSDA